MRHHTWVESDTYEIAVLVKKSLFDPARIVKYYGVADYAADSVLFDLNYAGKKTPSAKVISEYLDDLLEEFRAAGTKLLIVADAPYFKKLAKVSKTSKCIGEVLPCQYKGYEGINVVYFPAYSTAPYSPAVLDEIVLCIKNVETFLETGTNESKDFLTNYEYVLDTDRQLGILHELLEYPELAIDTETFSLSIVEAGLGTISFATSKTTGYTFYVEAVPTEDGSTVRVENTVALTQLRWFFDNYKGKAIYHNSVFDIKVILYAVYMWYDLLNLDGLVLGLKTLCRNFEDTQIITWCAINSTSQYSLSLKDNTREYAGNYGIDVTNILKQPALQLAEYNLKDSCCTLYLRDKYYTQLIDENLVAPYEEILRKSVKPIIHSELTGFPVDMDETKLVDKELGKLHKQLTKKLLSNRYIIKYTSTLNLMEYKKRNAKLKTKVIPLSEFDEQFNPNSPKQLIGLLYGQLDLPVLDYSEGGDPSTKNKVLEKLINHTEDPVVKDLLTTIMKLADVTKLWGTFIKGLLTKSVQDKTGQYWIFGNFNIGGTKSGRLSSSGGDYGLNLQQLPSGSDMAAYFKRCIKPPKGWLLTGADFASLEDRIDALVTKDTNKLKVYTDGYDGHCLRAHAYFPNQMPDITLAEPEQECLLLTLDDEDGTQIAIKEGDVIEYQGEELTFEEIKHGFESS